MSNYEFEVVGMNRAVLIDPVTSTGASHPAKPTGTIIYRQFYPEIIEEKIELDKINENRVVTAP